MKNFFQEAIKEFEHVSWPTNAETKKYFTIVISMIVALTIVLFIISTVLSAGLWSLRDVVNPNGTLSPSQTTTTGTQATLPDLANTLSGALPATK
jgi:preprotein translocase SecE subunit